MTEGKQVRLPRTANSQGISYAILINRICTQRTMGDAFEGRRFRPGATVAERELWPTGDQSETPLLLEYAGSDRSGSGHKRSQHLYLLWQFSSSNHEWREIARASAEGLEWVDALRPIALRHLAAPEADPQLAAANATSRVLMVLESELEVLDSADRRHLLGLLYEQFTARLSRAEG
jgi:hypothetical protein